MKKKLMFLMLFVFMVFAPNLSAARTNSIAVGGEYSSSHKTIHKAQMFTKYANQLGYNSKTIENPYALTMSTTWATYAASGGGILFFAGEGKPTEMYWNKNWQGGMYAYGIKSDNATGQSSYSYNNLNTLNLGNTDLVFYLGCNTGQLDVSNNLVSSSKALGAKISIGWKPQIRDDAAYWVERFMIKQTQGGTINDSINYADSYFYPSDSTKAWHIGVKDNSYLNKTLKGLQTLSLDENTDDREIKVLERDKDLITKSDIIEYVNKAFEIKDESNYKIEYNSNDFYDVYDLVLMVDGYRTNKGYTVFVKENKIEIYNNMGLYKESVARFNKIPQMNSFNENKLINETLDEYKNVYESENKKVVSLESTLKRMDLDTNKRYLDVNILIHDIVEDTNYISTESYEI